MGARSGNNYLTALRKLKAEVWIGGARVEDPTVHPAFVHCASSIASLYDMQIEHPGAMTYRLEDGERAGLSFIQPRDADDVRKRSAMFRRWAEYQRRDAGAHSRLPQRQHRGDGGGLAILCRQRPALRRQYPELLPRSAQTRLVRDAYAAQSEGQPRRRMGRTNRRRISR